LTAWRQPSHVRCPHNKSQAGFTLVEIAIVLVSSACLLGGILQGQEMITQAKIKNVIADMSGRFRRDVRLPGSLQGRWPAMTRRRTALGLDRLRPPATA